MNVALHQLASVRRFSSIILHVLLNMYGPYFSQNSSIDRAAVAEKQSSVVFPTL